MPSLIHKTTNPCSGKSLLIFNAVQLSWASSVLNWLKLIYAKFSWFSSTVSHIAYFKLAFSIEFCKLFDIVCDRYTQYYPFLRIQWLFCIIVSLSLNTFMTGHALFFHWSRPNSSKCWGFSFFHFLVFFYFFLKISLLEMLIAFGNEHLKIIF